MAEDLDMENEHVTGVETLHRIFKSWKLGKNGVERTRLFVCFSLTSYYCYNVHLALFVRMDDTITHTNA